MNKNLFITISKHAHKLTKIYVKKYKVSYSLQFAIFFKLLYSMHKKKAKVEVLKSVKAETIYNKSKHLYKMIVGAFKVDRINFYTKGTGLNIKYFIGTTCKNQQEHIDTNKVFNLFDLLDYDINIMPLLF